MGGSLASAARRRKGAIWGKERKGRGELLLSEKSNGGRRALFAARPTFAHAFGPYRARVEFAVMPNASPLSLHRIAFAVALPGLIVLSFAAAPADSAGGGSSVFNGKDLAGWKVRDPKGAAAWKVVSDVKLDPNDPKKLVGTGTGGGEGAALLRGPIDHGSDLYTDVAFGDCDLHIEFVVPKGSNSGVYLMGEYEVQVLDSFGKPDDRLRQGDVGAIYSAAKPTKNASKAPGEWQTFDIAFQAPRFDAAGKKTQNAKFLSVKLNGQEI